MVGGIDGKIAIAVVHVLFMFCTMEILALGYLALKLAIKGGSSSEATCTDREMLLFIFALNIIIQQIHLAEAAPDTLLHQQKIFQLQQVHHG